MPTVHLTAKLIDSIKTTNQREYFDTLLGEEMSQTAFARKLDVSPSHLCDIEKGRKVVSPERAARFAQVLGRSPEQFVRLSLQKLIDETGLKMIVNLEAA